MRSWATSRAAGLDHIAGWEKSRTICEVSVSAFDSMAHQMSQGMRESDSLGWPLSSGSTTWRHAGPGKRLAVAANCARTIGLESLDDISVNLLINLGEAVVRSPARRIVQERTYG